MKRPAAELPADRIGGLLLVLACLAGALRMARLGEWSLWIDEALTWADAHHSGEGLYNPLGYLVIRRVVESFGGVPVEWSLRLLPALVGWAIVPLAYWAFRPFAGGLRAGVVSLLLAASPWQLYWSQNARFYTLSEFACLLGGGLLLRSYVQGGTIRALIGVGIVATGALFHLQAVLWLGALVAAPWLLWMCGKPLSDNWRTVCKHLLWAAAPVLAVALLWAPDVWERYQRAKGIGTSLTQKAHSLAHFILATGSYVTPLWGAAFVMGAFLCWRSRQHVDRLVLFACVGVVIAAALASLFARVTAQYVFVLSPWIALVATVPLTRAFARNSGRFAFAGLLLLPTYADAGLYLTERGGERERWREAWLHVLENRRPGDLVAGMAAPVGELYLAPASTDLRHPRQVAWIDSYRHALAETWSTFPRRTWFVIRPDSLATWRPQDRATFKAILREECRLSARFPISATGRELAVEVYLRE